MRTFVVADTLGDVGILSFALRDAILNRSARAVGLFGPVSLESVSASIFEHFRR